MSKVFRRIAGLLATAIGLPIIIWFGWPGECGRNPDGALSFRAWGQELAAKVAGRSANCDPWSQIAAPIPIQSVELEWRSSWAHGPSRVVVVSSDGMFRVFRRADWLASERILEAKVIDLPAAKRVLANLQPLAIYNRIDYKRFTDSKYLKINDFVGPPKVRCYAKAFDANSLQLRWVDAANSSFETIYSGECVSVATGKAHERARSSFDKALEISGFSRDRYQQFDYFPE